MATVNSLEKVLAAIVFFPFVMAVVDQGLFAQGVATKSSNVQEPQAVNTVMTFDVVSIHPSDSGKFKLPNFDLTPGDHWEHNGSLFVAEFPITTYIGFAYNLWLSPAQFENLVAHQPKWVGHENMAIVMRASGEPTKDQARLMMRSMLADRFKLVVHFETQTQPVLALTLGRSGRLGPHLRANAERVPCDEPFPRAMQGTDAGFESLLPPPGCGLYRIVPRPDHMKMISARQITLPLVAAFISAYSKDDQPVVDQTGLRGTYDFALEWRDVLDLPTNTGDGAEPTSTLQESIEQQLGLKLTRTKIPMSVLVIDHVERPSEN